MPESKQFDDAGAEFALILSFDAEQVQKVERIAIGLDMSPGELMERFSQACMGALLDQPEDTLLNLMQTRLAQTNDANA